MKPLALGKIPIRVLNSTVLKMTGAPSDRIATPPRAGLDFAAIRMDRGFMVVSADPITGVVTEIGKHAVTVSANDVATSGNRPQFAESVVLLPEGSTRDDVEEIAEQMHLAARDLGIAIVGGHTEVTPGLKRPIVAVTAFSFVTKFVSSGDVRDGDTLMMTKTAGIEGTVAIAGDRLLSKRMPRQLVERAKGLASEMSIVEDAVTAYGAGVVHAMHDCTEGGVLGAVFEMSLASGLGFALDEKSVPVASETRQLCDSLSLNPLRLIGSGSLLLAVESGKEARVARALEPVCQVTRIGDFRKGKRVLRNRDGREVIVRSAPEDELWRALGRTS